MTIYDKKRHKLTKIADFYKKSIKTLEESGATIIEDINLPDYNLNRVNKNHILLKENKI